tara:strand:+ start:439 stop:663 length:225 start_codon:yes stop_codon:yes gene_type:complete
MTRRKKKMSMYDILEDLVKDVDDWTIDPRNMEPEDRHAFMESVFGDYLYFKDKGSKFSERYRELLVYLVKTYGH